jgi:peptide deformylase
MRSAFAPNILQYPHPLLREICAPVTDFSEVAHIGGQMMAAVNAPFQAKCLGLAANQVGILKRVIIVHQGTAWITLVNPVIVRASGVQTIRDGCMSFDFGRTFKPRTRPAFLQVEYQDVTGAACRRKAKGLHAAAIAHEVEHLDGKMFFDELTDVE